MKTPKQQIDLTALIACYFTDAPQVTLAKGEILLRENEQNDKMYWVQSGELSGFVEDYEGNEIALFRAEAGMFVGVYSFFSPNQRVYSTVRAETDCALTYVENPQQKVKVQGVEKTLAEALMPVVVNELFARQHSWYQVTIERELAVKKLMQSEKMALLGQMAAGLAHELNNAIGVIKGKSEWVGDTLKQLIATLIPAFSEHFEKGITQGNHLSSVDVRSNARKIGKEMSLSPSFAKKLAKTGVDIGYLKRILNKKQLVEQDLEQYYLFWEMGASIHDMNVASKHAAHIVRSVKELGASQQEKPLIEDPNETVNEALAIVKSYIRQVNLVLKLGEIPPMRANGGELVQVWLNLIKNACQAMLNSQTQDPRLVVKTLCVRDKLVFTVKDNGPGIPKELQEKVFMPNFTTKKNGLSFGLGLGLSIVQRIIEHYEGSIRLESEPGRTLFEVTIPLNP